MSFFTPIPKIDHARVTAAIRAAEQVTSGEIRVLLDRRQVSDPVAAAKKQFEQLGMTKTAERSGVLILFAPRSHNFAVIGDTGVHEKCGRTFWNQLADAMAEQFKKGDFTQGLVLGIERAGTLLGAHFPRQKDDRNELSDDIQVID